MHKDYAEAHRKHMAYEIDRQDNEWRRMNIKRTWWGRNSELVGGVLWCMIVAAVGVGVILAYGLR